MFAGGASDYHGVIGRSGRCALSARCSGVATVVVATTGVGGNRDQGGRVGGNASGDVGHGGDIWLLAARVGQRRGHGVLATARGAGLDTGLEAIGDGAAIDGGVHALVDLLDGVGGDLGAGGPKDLVGGRVGVCEAAVGAAAVAALGHADGVVAIGALGRGGLGGDEVGLR